MAISVTGHRDLIAKEIPKIEAEVKDFLRSLDSDSLIVYSALAEGADILVAKVAKELGIELRVLLPYNKVEYIKSFSSVESAKEFNSLLEYASSVEVVCDSTKNSTTKCYEELGAELSKRADILLALWDGVDNDKKGGTADVVKYFVENISDGVLKVIKVNRQGFNK